MFFHFSRPRGYGQLLGPPHLRHRHLPTLLLETLPPIFHVSLLSLLTYYTFYLNPESVSWHLMTIFVVAQILLNWFFFLQNKSIIRASPKNFPGYKHRYTVTLILSDIFWFFYLFYRSHRKLRGRRSNRENSRSSFFLLLLLLLSFGAFV